MKVRWSETIKRYDRLCENYVHGSTQLTTNGVVSIDIEYLSARPERGRRAPIEFFIQSDEADWRFHQPAYFTPYFDITSSINPL